MSRELRRVPLDFDWPLNEVWWGYRVTVTLPPCPDCKGQGWSEFAKNLRAMHCAGVRHESGALFSGWYGPAKETHGDALNCTRCSGAGNVATPDLRAAAEAFDEQWACDPPTGEGWQMWETVSEGSPVSPVFGDAEGLIEWMTTPDPSIMGHPYSRAAAEALVKIGHSIGSFLMSRDETGTTITDGVEALITGPSTAANPVLDTEDES